MSDPRTLCPWLRRFLAEHVVTERNLARNTRERIGGPGKFIDLNESYPGDWRCTVRRIDECADTVVTVTEISDGETSFFAVSFLEVRDGRIARAEEYFAENGPPPFDRSAFAERY